MIFRFSDELRTLLQTETLINQTISSKNKSVHDDGADDNKYVIDLTLSSEDDAVYDDTNKNNNEFTQFHPKS